MHAAKALGRTNGDLVTKKLLKLVQSGIPENT